MRCCWPHTLASAVLPGANTLKRVISRSTRATKISPMPLLPAGSWLPESSRVKQELPRPGQRVARTLHGALRNCDWGFMVANASLIGMPENISTVVGLSSVANLEFGTSSGRRI